VAPDPACAVLRAPACRESLDRDHLLADPWAHRAARLASDVMMLARAATGRWIIASSRVAEKRSYQRQRLRDMQGQRRWRGAGSRCDVLRTGSTAMEHHVVHLATQEERSIGLWESPAIASSWPSSVL